MKKNKLSFVIGIIFLFNVFGINIAMSALETGSTNRHYFEHCDAVKMMKLNKGMAQEEARHLAGGTEFAGTETFQKGFKFAIDKKSSAFVTFTNWAPGKDARIDFFCSDMLVLMVAYNADLKIKQVARIARGTPPVPAALSDLVKKSN